MKRLAILRHAKAEPKGAYGDFERRLADVGRREMRAAAAQIAAERLSFDVALVSPAARTRETWTLAGPSDGETRFDERIYDASLETLMEVVREIGEAGSAILVGHNPGVEELASALVAPDDDGLPGDFPTAGLAVIDLPAESWGDVRPGEGRLALFISPDKAA